MKVSYLFRPLAVVWGFYFFFVVVSQAAPGDLDLSFGGTGKVQIGFGYGYDNAKSLAVQPDGKLIIAGDSAQYPYASNTIELVRFGTNNAFDPTFGSFGKVSVSVLKYPQVFTMQLQADGKILLAGCAQPGANIDFAILRFNSDGSLDSTFGTNGVTLTDFEDPAYVTAMSVQSDGKIIVVGQLTDYIANFRYFTLARYTTNGLLDASFGEGGTHIESGNGTYSAGGLSIQADGKILVSGSDEASFALFRYNGNGQLDSSFGGGSGVVGTSIEDSSSARAIVIQAEDSSIAEPDKILVGGSASSGTNYETFALVRYNSDGTLDQTFGTNGFVTTSIVGNSNVFLGNDISALLVSGEGNDRKITAVGTGLEESIGVTQFMAVAQYDTSGNLNTNFNGTGTEILSFGLGQAESGIGVAAQNGKVVVAGTTMINNVNSDFAAVRLNNDGSLDSTFNGSGIVTADVANNFAIARAVAMQSDGKLVAVGQVYDGTEHLLALTRLNADGSLDENFGTGGRLSTGVGDTFATGLAIQPDGKIVASAVADYSTNGHFAAFRFLSNGSLDNSFGSNGVALITLSDDDDGPSGIALQFDGKIVLAGSGQSGDFGSVVVTRFTTTGVPDTSFNGTGKVSTSFTGQDSGQAVQIQSDGKIIVAGFSFATNGGLELIRYNPDGSLDSSFGDQGVVITPFAEGGFLGAGLAISPDEKLIITGDINDTQPACGMARFLTNGAPDFSFNGDGFAETSFNTLKGGYGLAIALQGNGKILVAGTSDNRTNEVFTTIRYDQDGSLDQTFGAGGISAQGFGNDYDALAYAMTLDANGKIVLAGDAGGYQFGLLRLQGDAVLKILSLTHSTSGHVILTGTGVPNATYTVQGAFILERDNFSVLGTTTSDASGQWEYEDTNPSSQTRFYRLSYP